MTAFDFDRPAWAALTAEAPVDSRRRIIDAHHHLWDRGESKFLVDDLLACTGAGHNVTDTVFVECRASYLQTGSEALQPVGETRFVIEQGRAAAGSTSGSGAGRGTRVAAAIISFADLTLGDAVEEVLDAHELAGDGHFRGVRHGTTWDIGLRVHVQGRPGLMSDDGFRRGIARLGRRGYSFDAWVYHPQLFELADLARATEGTMIVLDHLGAPLNIEHYAKPDEVRLQWRAGMGALATCANVVVKLGGIGMDFLFATGWSSRDRPPGSDEVAAWWGDDVRWVIDTFGPSRCMFESNFPVDQSSLGYTVLWNAFQKMAASYSDDEQDALFAGTAGRVYWIEP